jgi:hypothetical protein
MRLGRRRHRSGRLASVKMARRVAGRIREDSRYRRRILLGGTGAGIGAVTLLAAAFTVTTLAGRGDAANRLAAAGDILVAATFVLAVIAALVALLAYAVSTGPPDLRVSIVLGDSSPNSPVVAASYEPELVLHRAETGAEEMSILVRNNSSYPARNPAVAVWMHDIVFTLADKESSRNWPVIGYAGEGSTARGVDPSRRVAANSIQWDGGPNYSIHGHSTRLLPVIHFGELCWVSATGEPKMTIEILADSYRKLVEIDVKFRVGDKYATSKLREMPEWL